MIKKSKPHVKILTSFILLILIGSLILIMPFSVKDNVSHNFLDALFTSTTSVTITGLVTIDIASTYTIFGKIIIAILIQLGGLSITTLSFFFLILFGSKIGFVDRDLIKENINYNSRSGLVKTIKIIVKVTLIIELIGVVLLTGFFIYDGYSFFNALGHATFHTISAFNNAGITIFSNSSSLMLYKNNVYFNLVTIFLIVSGGMGTLVIYDIFTKGRYKNYSTHTKIIIKMTLIMFLVGAVSIFLFEKNITVLQALMHAATVRTAGFYSYDYNTVKAVTLLFTIIIMFIGGSPASSAGGIKVTNLYTLSKTTISNLTGNPPLVNKRKIVPEYESKAALVLILNLVVLIIGITVVALFDSNLSLTSVVFEAVSALSNTGLSLSLTPYLSVVSKITIILLMFIGRVGVITFINAILIKDKKISSIDYLKADYLI